MIIEERIEPDEQIRNIFADSSIALKDKDLATLKQKYVELRQLLSEYPDKETPEYHHYYVNAYALHEAIMKLHNAEASNATQPAAVSSSPVSSISDVSSSPVSASIQPIQSSQIKRPMIQNIVNKPVAVKPVIKSDNTGRRTVWIIILIVSAAMLSLVLFKDFLYISYIDGCSLTGPFKCSEYGLYSSAVSPTANYVIVKYDQSLFSSEASNITIDPASVYMTGCNRIYIDKNHSIIHPDEFKIILDCDNTRDTKINDRLTLSYFDGSDLRESVLSLDIAKASRNPETGALTQID